MQLSETPRTRLTRLGDRGRTEIEDLYAVLDAGLVGHLGLVRDGAPVVLPMGYGRRGDTLYLHGSSGAGWSRVLDGAAVCFTVTHVDGVVYARSVFDHSLNYRSAVVLGTTRLLDDADEKVSALEVVTEQLSPGSWSYARLPTKRELAATSVYALELTEASVKIRTGPPHDEADDVVAGGRWAGVVPVRTVFDSPEAAPDLEPGPILPAHVSDRSGLRSLGATCATSDVDITGRSVRWTAITHSVPGFLDNAVVLAVAFTVITG